MVNHIHELDSYLVDIDKNDEDTTLEITCQACYKKKIMISVIKGLAFTLKRNDSMDKRSTGSVGSPNPFANFSVHEEKALIFPCGHLFGDRCTQDKLLKADDKILACPACGFRMAYENCGHAIAPASIPAEVDGCMRDTFPLTIPEGGPKPSHCKECRWKSIQVKLRYALSSECWMCSQRAKAGVPLGDSAEHDAHRARHIEYGMKEVLGEIMMLVQPDFITRETSESARKAEEEKNRRDAHGAMLTAMVLTELEETVWHDTPVTTRLSEEWRRRHATGMHNIEDYILSLLMDYGKDCRRMW